MACLSVTRVSISPVSLIGSNHPHELANGDRPSGDPLASVKQIHYRVVPARGEVATTGIESGSDAASNVRREVFAQRKGGDVDDADGVLRHVGKDHTVTRMVEHRGRRRQLPMHKFVVN